MNSVTSNSEYAVCYDRPALPGPLACGGICELPVVVHNAGRTAWRSRRGARGAVELAVYLDDRLHGTVALPAEEVPPGGSECLVVRFCVPRQGGRHLLRLDLVAQQVAFFSECGSPALVVAFEADEAGCDGEVAGSRLDIDRLARGGLRWARLRWLVWAGLSGCAGAVPALERRALAAWKKANDELGAREYLLGVDTPLARPSRLVLDTTSRCNLRCPFCHRHKMIGTEGWVGDMPASVLDGIVRRLFPTARHVNISLVGEPTLCRHIDRLLAACERFGTRLSFTTNGTRLLSDDLGRRLAPWLSHLEISIDSLDAKTFATLRAGAELGTVQAAIAHMAALRRTLAEESRFGLGLSVTLFSANLAELPGLARWAAAAGCTHIRATFGVLFEGGAIGLAADPKSALWTRVRAETVAIAAEAGLGCDLPPELVIGEAAAPTLAPRCSYPWDMMRIDHRGSVLSCLHPHPHHSLGAPRDLVARWRGPEMRELRRQWRSGIPKGVCRECHIVSGR